MQQVKHITRHSYNLHPYETHDDWVYKKVHGDQAKHMYNYIQLRGQMTVTFSVQKLHFHILKIEPMANYEHENKIDIT